MTATDGFQIGEHVSERALLDVTRFNLALSMLRERRATEIAISGALSKSKLAWKIATYQQPMLYRVVMLANSCASSWNGQNLLGAYLASRALVETVVLFLSFEEELCAHVDRADLGAVDVLVTNRMFSTRDRGLVAEFPDTRVKNILTIIDSWDKRRLPGIREHYDFLSERCHPNTFGHHQLFSRRDPHTNTTHYSDWRQPEMHLDYILGGAMLIEFVGGCMDRLDAAIVQVSELQHKIHPVIED